MIRLHESYLSDGAVVTVREMVGFRGTNRHECRIRNEESAGAVSLTGYVSYDEAYSAFARAVIIDNSEELIGDLFSE